jgi:DNA-binding transcriptional regulator YhcF (GntR family)
LEAIERRWMEGNMIKTGIQLDEKLPLYEKVAGKISFLIEQGTFRPGDKVSSIRNLT